MGEVIAPVESILVTYQTILVNLPKLQQKHWEERETVDSVIICSKQDVNPFTCERVQHLTYA